MDWEGGRHLVQFHLQQLVQSAKHRSQVPNLHTLNLGSRIQLLFWKLDWLRRKTGRREEIHEYRKQIQNEVL